MDSISHIIKAFLKIIIMLIIIIKTFLKIIKTMLIIKEEFNNHLYKVDNHTKINKINQQYFSKNTELNILIRFINY